MKLSDKLLAIAENLRFEFSGEHGLTVNGNDKDLRKVIDTLKADGYQDNTAIMYSIYGMEIPKEISSVAIYTEGNAKGFVFA